MADDDDQRRQRIQEILDHEQFHIVYQPIVDLATGRTLGVEALTRFDGTELPGPAEWFAEGAAVGLGTDLELAAVRAALRAIDDLPPRCYMSLNVSPVTAVSEGLEPILRCCDRAERAVLELTEHSEVADYIGLVAGLLPLRQLGARVAVDDAGAGFASLYPLIAEAIGRRFPYFHPGFFNGIFSIALLGGLLAPASLGYAAAPLGVGVVIGIPLVGTVIVIALLLLIWLEAKISGR